MTTYRGASALEIDRPNMPRRIINGLVIGTLVIVALLIASGRVTSLSLGGFTDTVNPFGHSKSVHTAGPGGLTPVVQPPGDVIRPGIQNAILQTAKKYAYHDAYPRFASGGCKPVYIPNVANNTSSGIAQTISQQCARPAYKRAWNRQGYSYRDCAAFVASILSSTGIDRNYPGTWTPGQIWYVRHHPDKYKIVSRRQLQPGDILLSRSHTEIYGGSTLGGDYVAIDASGGFGENNQQFNHVPMYNGVWDVDFIFNEGGFGVRVLK